MELCTEQHDEDTKPVITTDRLILRRFHSSDADAMGRIFGDPEVMYYGDGVKTQEWVREWLRRWLVDYYANWGFGMWAVVEKTGGEALGYCGLSRFPQRCGQGETEIGYRIARAHWGRGLATEAARAVRDYGFGALGLERLIAMIDPANGASIRVAEKIGMKYERDALLEGYTHPDRVYTIVRGANNP